MTSSRQLLDVLFLVGAALVVVPQANAQDAGYRWETYALAPGESLEGSTTGTIVRTGPYLELRLDEAGKLSVPYRVGIRFTGSFSCVTPHDIEITIRVTPTEKSWSTASWDPPSKEKLTFHLPAGSHPNGVAWSEQEGPRLSIQWDLGRAPQNATVSYLVVAFPVPAQGPADCQPQGASEGMRYLSRINVTRAVPTPPVPSESVPEPKGALGFGGSALAVVAIGLGLASARRRS